MTVEELLEQARARIRRLSPEEAAADGAQIVDVRSETSRRRDGVVPGSLHVPLTVLQWRLDQMGDRVLVLCDHGFSSSLAAASLVDLGVDAGEVVGGFEAWRAAGLPVVDESPLEGLFPEGLAELHTHLGGSVSSDIMWSLAHEQGIALPTRDFWEFDRMVTVSDPRGVPDLDSLDRIYHLTELIQSSPLAVERSVHSAIGGAYRSQGITTLELRFNPMKRNRGGERDLDHIILAAIRGLDLASLEYPQVRAGLILMMDRTFSAEQNMVIVEKAIRYAPRGVVGVDIAGPRPGGARYDYTAICPHVAAARAAGLGVTIHVGEEGGRHGVEELHEVVDELRPDRIGHGILAAGDVDLMAKLRDADITLEICPTSNLLTKALSGEDAVRETFGAFVEHGVPFTIATDGPEMMRTHLRDEFELLLRLGALGRDEAAAANTRGHKSAFA